MNAITQQGEIEQRIEQLQRGFRDDLDRVECSALGWLKVCGIPDLQGSVLKVTGKDRYSCLAAESIAWTACRLRAKELPEAFRGLLQAVGYKGQNGGFLPAHLSDNLGTLQAVIQSHLSR